MIGFLAFIFHLLAPDGFDLGNSEFFVHAFMTGHKFIFNRYSSAKNELFGMPMWIGSSTTSGSIISPLGKIFQWVLLCL